MILAPAYTLRPGDIIGQTPITRVMVMDPTNPNAEVLVKLALGGELADYLLAIPAQENVRLTATAAYAHERTGN